MADSPSYVPQTSETNPVKQNVAIQQLYTSVADAASAADAAALKATTITAGTGLTGGGDLSANRTIALGVPVVVANGGTGAATAAAARGNLAAATTTQIDFISGGIKSPAAQHYYIIIYVPYTTTINSFAAYNTSGTCTAALTIAGVPVTGGSINVNTASVQTTTCTANNVASAGTHITILVSAVASSANLWFEMTFTRTLA